MFFIFEQQQGYEALDALQFYELFPIDLSYCNARSIQGIPSYAGCNPYVLPRFPQMLYPGSLSLRRVGVGVAGDTPK